MIEIKQRPEFKTWIAALRDRTARAIIIRRTARLGSGNSGNSRSVGGGVVELKVDYGPGYRVYFVKRDTALILLLCGGDKSSQAKDIQRAKELASLEETGD